MSFLKIVVHACWISKARLIVVVVSLKCLFHCSYNARALWRYVQRQPDVAWADGVVDAHIDTATTAQTTDPVATHKTMSAGKVTKHVGVDRNDTRYGDKNGEQPDPMQTFFMLPVQNSDTG